MSEPKNQHYVSQFYLKKFADHSNPKMIWVTDVADAKKKKVLFSTKQCLGPTAAIRHLYSHLNADDSVNYDMERSFGKIESPSGQAWGKVEEESFSFTRGSCDRKTISQYIAMQHLRGPRLIQVALHNARHGGNFGRDVGTWTPDDIVRFHGEVATMPETLGETTQDYADREGFRAHISGGVYKLASILEERMAWVRFICPKPALITSDSPVFIHNPVTDLGSHLGDVNAVVYFPMTPRVLLCLTQMAALRQPESIDGTTSAMSSEMAKGINAGIFNFAHKFAFSPWDMATAVPEYFGADWHS